MLRGLICIVLVRLFGSHTELYFNRNIDLLIYTIFSERKLGPSLLGVFPQGKFRDRTSGLGRIEEFIAGRPLLTCELAIPDILKLIAEKYA